MTASDAALQFLAGQRQKYSIDPSAPLAYGRLSVLFKGTSDDGSVICVKLFRDRLQTDDDLDVDFSRELQILRTLEHPSILPVLDFGASTDGQARPFLVLPFCARGNLRTLLETRSFLPVDLALTYLRDVAGALDYSHHTGVIHGDVKPENILIVDDTRACLADFGAARYRLKSSRATTAREATGPFTEFYASPEQIENGTQSIRSDVYSFAMVAYELLTGKPPVATNAPAFQRMLAKIQGRIIDPFEVNPALPQPVGEALLRGLSKNSKDRPSSAGELVLMIEHGFVSRGLVARVSRTTTREVFVVHGHDEASKEKIARFLDRIGLKAVILHEMASAGRTIIEKIEAYSDVAAAVVLLTADDVGALSSERKHLRPRARQNVIFEMGYFAAKLGRNRTIALHSAVELPSDVSGVVYIPLDDANAWRFDLIRELRAAGLTVDANAAFE